MDDAVLEIRPYRWINRAAVRSMICRLFPEVKFSIPGKSENADLFISDAIMLDGSMYSQAYIQIDIYSPRFHYYRRIDDESDLLQLLSSITAEYDRNRFCGADDTDIKIF